jgi:hypothetical protein
VNFVVLSSRIALGLVLTATACAGSKGHDSGRDYKTKGMKKPPYYTTIARGFNGIPPGSSLGVLPVQLSERLVGSGYVTESRRPQFDSLVGAMGAFLGERQGYVRLGIPDSSAKNGPNVYVGQEGSEHSPVAIPEWLSNYDYKQGSPGGTRSARMILSWQPGTPDWRRIAADAALAKNADYILYTTIGIGHFRQVPSSGLFKSDVFQLGKGYEVSAGTVLTLIQVDWKGLEALEVVGMLLDKEGNVVKVGGEGFLPLVPGSLDVILRKRRDDLPGKPPNWQEALRTLAEQLTNQEK